MVAGTMRIRGERFVIVPESDYERMCAETRRRATAEDEPPLPMPDDKGDVPAVAYARASLARKLIRDRQRVGLPPGELALRAGISGATLRRIEMGKLMPDAATFKKIHRALAKAEREA
jgi:ribosome-binding protein aMBF1 (putative translation factor)